MADGGRTITILGGFYTLLQGLIWSLISIAAVGIYNCSLINPFLLERTANNKNSIFTLFYISYFNGSDCSSPLIINGIHKAAPSTTRTYYFMYVSALLNAVWIPVSILLIVTGCCKVKGLCGTASYLPWILITLIISIFEVIAGIYYASDITHTLSPNDYIKFVDGDGTWNDVFGNTNLDTAMPAVVMTLFFGRFLIFWFLNIAFIYHCIKECRGINSLNLQGAISTEEIMDDETFRTWNHSNNNKKLNSHLPKAYNQNQSIHPVSQNPNKVSTDFNTREENSSNSYPSSPADTRLEKSGVDPNVYYKVDELGITIDEVRIPRPVGQNTNQSLSDLRVDRLKVFDYMGRPAPMPQFRPRAETSDEPEQIRPRGAMMQGPRGTAPWSYLHPGPLKSAPSIPAPDYTNNVEPVTSVTNNQRPPVNRKIHGVQ